MSTTNGKQLAEAVRLSRPGSVLTPDEIKAIIAVADTIEAGGGASTKDEERVVLSASRLRIYGPSTPRPAPVPPELLQREAAATDVRQVKRLAAGEALEAVVVARRAVFRAKNQDELHRLIEESLGAERAWTLAREDEQRAQAALCDVRHQVELARRAATK